MNDFSIMNSEFYIPLSKRSKKNGLRVKITSSRSPPIIYNSQVNQTCFISINNAC